MPSSVSDHWVEDQPQYSRPSALLRLVGDDTAAVR